MLITECYKSKKKTTTYHFAANPLLHVFFAHVQILGKYFLFVLAILQRGLTGLETKWHVADRKSGIKGIRSP